MNKLDKNKKYSDGKRALEQRVIELEKEVFKYKFAFSQIQQIAKSLTSDLIEEGLNNNKEMLYISREDLNTIYAKKYTEKPREERQYVKDFEATKEQKSTPKKIKRNKEPIIVEEPELTSEQKELERQKRVLSARDTVIENNKLYAQALKEIEGRETQEELTCSICSVRSSEVGFSEKLQKNYCMTCLQKASINIK